MMVAVTIMHVLACAVLVLVVLLQAGKGADIGAVFGGASTTIFGSSGAGSFLTRLTTGAAIVFMATSLTLTYGSTRSTSTTIMPESAAPVAPEQLPAGGAPSEDAGGGDVAEGGAAVSDEAVVEGGTTVEGGTAASEAGEPAAAGGEAAGAPAAERPADEAAPAGPGSAEPPARP